MEDAISLKKVCKEYRIFKRPFHKLVDALGIYNVFPFLTPEYKIKHALDGITVDIKKGERIAFVGRNGAGKTTLLKMICGNLTPTSGRVRVNGSVTALMSMGSGFHPDYTGRENALSILQFNGCTKNQIELYINDIIDFCELGEYFDQPFKSYSLGMQSRLMFSVATAVSPDILVVDEVLGAGDAYFIAKSRRRMDRLIESGCTLILVSHSMQQVLELCDKAIWIDAGAVRMTGSSHEVTTAYEKHLSGLVGSENSPQHLDDGKLNIPVIGKHSTIDTPFFTELQDEFERVTAPYKPINLNNHTFSSSAKTGISRWENGSGKLLFVANSITDGEGNHGSLISLMPAQFTFKYQAMIKFKGQVRYSLAVYDHLGRLVLNLLSREDSVDLEVGAVREFACTTAALRLGAGTYLISVSIHGFGLLENFNSSPLHDLLNRSFEFEVRHPASNGPMTPLFYHPVDWSVR